MLPARRMSHQLAARQADDARSAVSVLATPTDEAAIAQRQLPHIIETKNVPVGGLPAMRILLEQILIASALEAGCRCTSCA